MYTSFSVENFRCFDNLTVEPLARVNLIAGQNNVGKTALLEALWMLSYPTAPREALRISQWRDSGDYGQGQLFADLFFQYNAGLAIGFKAEDSRRHGLRTLNVTRQYRAEQPIPIVDWSEMSETELEDEAISNFDLDNELVFEHIDESGIKSSAKAWLDLGATSGRLRPVLQDIRKADATTIYPSTFERPGSRYNARALATLFGQGGDCRIPDNSGGNYSAA